MTEKKSKPDKRKTAVIAKKKNYSEEDHRKKLDARNKRARERRAEIKAGTYTPPAKKNPNRSEVMKGNENARTWTDKDIEEVAETIKKAAPNAYAIVGIIVDLGISQDQYYDLVERYPLVSQAHKYAKSCIANKAWTQSFKGEGFPNVLTMAIKRHDANHMKAELEQLKASENVKAEARIREKKELAEKIEEGNGNVLDEFDEFLQWKAARAAKKKAV